MPQPRSVSKRQCRLATSAASRLLDSEIIERGQRLCDINCEIALLYDQAQAKLFWKILNDFSAVSNLDLSRTSWGGKRVTSPRMSGQGAGSRGTSHKGEANHYSAVRQPAQSSCFQDLALQLQGGRWLGLGPALVEILPDGRHEILQRLGKFRRNIRQLQ